VRIDLPAWSDADVADYLAAGLERAGRPAELFSAAATATIRRFAAGVPEVIRRLAQLSLAAADAEAAADRLHRRQPCTVYPAWAICRKSRPLILW
jgi:type II secretory pathway predicted ATPase ExeA